MAINKQGRFYKTFLNMRAALFFLAIGILISIFSRRAFLNYLGPELVGLNATITNVLGALSVAEMGIFSAITYFLYKPIRDNNYAEMNEIISILARLYKRIGYAMLCAGMIITCLIPFIFQHSAVVWYYPYLTLWVMLFGATSGYFFTYAIVLFYSEQVTYKTILIYEGGTKLKVILQMLVVTMIGENPYLWWLGVEFLYNLLVIIAVKYQLKVNYPWLQTSHITVNTSTTLYKKIIEKIKHSFIYKFSIVVVNNASPIVVFSCLNLYYVTIFTNYLIISKMLTNINAMINNAIFAGLGNLVLDDDIQKEEEVTNSFIAFMFFWGSFIAWGFYMFSSDIISLLFGAQYVLPSNTVLLFAIMMFLMTIRCGPETCLFSQGIIHDVWSPIVHTVIYLGGTVILGWQWGISGVLSGIILAELFMVLWKPFFMSRHKSFISYKIYMMRIIWYIILTLIATVIVSFIPIPTILFSSPSINVFAHIIVDGILYLLLLVVVYSLGSHGFRDIIKRGILIVT